MTINQKKLWKLGGAQVAIAFAIVSCQAVPIGPSAMVGGDLGSFIVAPVPEVLADPATYDWTYHRFSGRNVSLARQQHRRSLLAFGDATAWGTGGRALTTWGAGGTDSMPNGPASIFGNTSTPPALQNKTFFVTKNGLFIKADKTTAPDAATDALALGKTFSSTFVTLSPSGNRAYVVSDDGRMFVINTVTMTKITHVDLGQNAYGCTVSYDPTTSAHNDRRDTLYVPDNSGRVTKYVYDLTTGLSAGTSYSIATSFTPHPNAVAVTVNGVTAKVKIKAPCVVFAGVIYVGDQSGRLHTYDTATDDQLSYVLGSPIEAAPAIELNYGHGEAVAAGMPCYVFVPAGPSCFWINLASTLVTRSRSLYIDDNAPAQVYDHLRDYAYDATVTSATVSLAENCTIRTDSDSSFALKTGSTTNYKTDTVLGAAECDVNDEAGGSNGSRAGGPILCYLRFSTGSPSTAVIKSAQLQLTVQNGSTGAEWVPEFRRCGSYLVDGAGDPTTTPWTYANMTRSNRPLPEATNVSTYIGAQNGDGSVNLNPGSPMTFDISGVFGGGAAAEYTGVIMYNKGGGAMWGYGDGAVTGIYKASSTFRSLQGSAAQKPKIVVGQSKGSFPTPSIETAPVIDAFTKKAYVFYGNALYEVDWSSTLNWADDDSVAKSTLFDLSYFGRVANGGGASYNSQTRYVNNVSAPVFNDTLTACYVLDRTPADAAQKALNNPTTWDYSLSKFTLPLTDAAPGRLAAGSVVFQDVSGDASRYLAIDPFANGGNVWFGLAGKVYQYDK